LVEAVVAAEAEATAVAALAAAVVSTVAVEVVSTVAVLAAAAFVAEGLGEAVSVQALSEAEVSAQPLSEAAVSAHPLSEAEVSAQPLLGAVDFEVEPSQPMVSAAAVSTTGGDLRLAHLHSD
jgi:hypothetical protein